MKKEKFQMIAKTFQELEDVLAEELVGLGAENVEIGNRMVSFEGDLEMLYKANLFCRTALRILKPMYNFTANCTDDVYDKIKEIAWEDYLSADQTFSIDSTVYSEEFKHSKFVTYRVKDAIVDYFNDKCGQRPSVRMNKADLILNLHISNQNCTLSIDSSGEPLYKRGYRVDQTEAPLNEVLAAGMILKTGWKGDSNFIDPMCGSGTLLIEAAMIACNIAPGIYRHDYAFERWADFDEELFDRLYNDDSNVRDFNYKIYGSDISPRAIQIAEENIKSASLSRYIDLTVMPIQKYETAPEKGVLVTNPPYGERISSDDLLGLYQMLGERLKHIFQGYDAWIISYREECFEKIGLKPAVKIDLMNGSLECQYRKYEIFDGKYRDFKTESGGFREREREKPDFKRLDPKRDRDDFRRSASDSTYPRRDRRDDRESGRPDRFSNSDSRYKRGDGDQTSDRRSDRPDRTPFRGRGDSERGGDRERAPYNKDRSDRSSDDRRSDRPDRTPFRGRGDSDRGGDRERAPYNKDRSDRSSDDRRSDRPDRTPFRGRGDSDRGGDRERTPYNKDRSDRSSDDRRSDRPDRTPFRGRGDSERGGDRERTPYNKDRSDRSSDDRRSDRSDRTPFRGRGDSERGGDRERTPYNKDRSSDDRRDHRSDRSDFRKSGSSDRDNRKEDKRDGQTREERVARSRFTISDGTEKFVSFRKPSIPDPDKKESKRERFIRPKNEPEDDGE